MAMFFTAEKIHARVNELQPYRYRNRQPISNWQVSNDDIHGQLKFPSKDLSYQPIAPGYKWTHLNQYAWLHADIKLPEDKNTVFLFNFGLPSNLNQTGFEGLLFVDGKPLQGIDSHHEEVLLKDDMLGKQVSLDIKLWTGMYGRHGDRTQPIVQEFKFADIAQLDPQTDHLYLAMRNMIDTVDILSKDAPSRYEMLNTLDHAARVLDWQQPGSAEFYASVAKAAAVVDDYLKGVVKSTPVTVTALGHTHIDLAWLWQLKHTREKAARSWSTVLSMMDHFSDYVFLHTTPQLYEYIQHDYPEIFKQIQKRVDEGRWEIEGGMWVEADCNIPSGESLVRQLMFGIRYIQKNFHHRSRYLWLPDVFGYSWALPQILRKAGLNTFMTTKISWNEYNRMPNDTFMWKGIDGTKILTHFITTPDAGKMKDNPDSWFYTYNGEMTPASVKGLWDAYSDKRINNNLLLAYGYGDGGGGVNRDMIESRRILNQLPGLPKVETATAGKFFDKLHDNIKQAAKDKEYVPTWDGELYLEFHRGTYTSHAYMKKMNRRMELMYRQLEYDSILKMLSGSAYPQSQLNDGWKILLRNQFHDIIPGSAIHEVYEDCHRDYEHANEIAQQVAQNIGSNDTATSYTIVNNQAWSRHEVVKVNTDNQGSFTTTDGQTLLSQPVDGGYLVETPVVPATGSVLIQFKSNDQSQDGESSSLAQLSENGLTTNNYCIRWNDQGQLIEIYDRQADREVLKENGLGNTLEVYEDKPRDYDAWNIDFYYYQKKQILDADRIEVIENSPLRTVVQFDYHYLHSKISQQLILHADNKRIDFVTKLDWHDHQKLLKAGFDTAIRSTTARYQIQFGNLERTTTWNTSWDWAKFESVGHQWADLSEHNYGVALLNNAKYGYGVHGQKMTISLLKSAISPDPEQDIGKHSFTYSLLPHKGDFVSGQVEENAWALNSPLQVLSGKPFDQNALFKINGSGINLDSVKKAEDRDSVIVRFHDYTGGTHPVELIPQFTNSGWREVNLLEEADDQQWSEEPVKLHVKPYEIKTLEFRK